MDLEKISARGNADVQADIVEALRRLPPDTIQSPHCLQATREDGTVGVIGNPNLTNNKVDVNLPNNATEVHAVVVGKDMRSEYIGSIEFEYKGRAYRVQVS